MGTCEEIYNQIFARYSQIIYKEIRDTDAEVEFLDWAFRDLAEAEVRRVLDIACGTGRHSTPLAQRGYEVVGLDLSSSMLVACRDIASEASTCIPLAQGDMQFLPFKPESFDGIFSMFSSFNHLLEDDEILAALREFHRSLKPGGILVLDLISPLKFISKGLDGTEIHKGEEEGVYIERKLTYRIDEVNAIWHQAELAVIRDGPRTWENTEHHCFRLLTYPEICHLLEESGFRGAKCFGNFHQREEAAEQADRLITVASKPKETKP